MDKPVVSVIVPIYNTGQNLKFLVDSIIAQTFKDFELLLIDDGSTDDVTPPLCDEYGAVDSRIRVFHKQNGGVSDSRNYGIDNAKGTFIAFADHDDYMFPDNLQTIVDEIGNLDLLICGYVGGQRENISSCVRHEKKTWEVVAGSKDEMADAIPRIGYKNAPVWNQLFRRNIIVNNYIRFQNIQYEDELFSITYLSKVDSLKRIDFEGYYWINTPNSQGSHHSYIAEMNWITQMEVLCDHIIQKYELQGQSLHTYNWRIANRLAVLCVKGYYKDSHKPWRERMKVWESVKNDKWLKERIDPSIMGRNIHIVLRIAQKRLYYLLDPLFQVYGLMNS